MRSAGGPQLKRNPLGSMRLLEWLGIVPRDQREAIRLLEPECWCVAPTQNAAAFCRALAELAPPDSVLYLEGSTEDQIPAFLEQRQVPNPTPVALGTLLPRSDRYHIAATAQNLSGLSQLIDAYRIPIPVIHVILYRGRQVLLEWYDAFTDDPMYVSPTMPEARVESFARALGSEYRWTRHAA